MKQDHKEMIEGITTNKWWIGFSIIDFFMMAIVITTLLDSVTYVQPQYGWLILIVKIFFGIYAMDVSLQLIRRLIK